MGYCWKFTEKPETCDQEFEMQCLECHVPVIKKEIKCQNHVKELQAQTSDTQVI